MKLYFEEVAARLKKVPCPECGNELIGIRNGERFGYLFSYWIKCKEKNVIMLVLVYKQHIKNI